MKKKDKEEKRKKAQSEMQTGKATLEDAFGQICRWFFT